MLELAAREAQQVFGGAGYQKAGRGATVEQISRDLRMMVCTDISPLFTDRSMVQTKKDEPRLSEAEARRSFPTSQ